MMEKRKMSIWKNLKMTFMIYDTALKTGNRALDIVLMEKHCSAKIMIFAGLAWQMENILIL